MKADQMVAGYNGVKYDAKGQNTLGSSLVIQMRGGQYVAGLAQGEGDRRYRSAL